MAQIPKETLDPPLGVQLLAAGKVAVNEVFGGINAVGDAGDMEVGVIVYGIPETGDPFYVREPLLDPSACDMGFLRHRAGHHDIVFLAVGGKVCHRLLHPFFNGLRRGEYGADIGAVLEVHIITVGPVGVALLGKNIVLVLGIVDELIGHQTLGRVDGRVKPADYKYSFHRPIPPFTRIPRSNTFRYNLLHSRTLRYPSLLPMRM